jgi:hypothetical protein
MLAPARAVARELSVLELRELLLEPDLSDEDQLIIIAELMRRG